MNLRRTGPDAASHVIVLAPGDSGRATDTAPTLIADGLAAAGFSVRRFDFPPCDTEDSAQRDALLAKHIRRAAQHLVVGQHLVLAGMSRGARVSASLVSELDAVALLAFAYPFHSRHEPNPGSRPADLAAVNVPVFLCQGTRDSHGNQQQITGYGLPPHIHVHWLNDANHALHPRERSGHTQAQQLTEATAIAAQFIREL